jgi:SAM-dependent methyltransferase
MMQHLDLYEEAKRLTEEDLLKPSSKDLFMAHRKDGQILPVMKSGVEPVNFVYGEVTFQAFLEVLKKVSFLEGETFVDLGCGTGNCLAAAALYRSLSNAEDLNSHEKSQRCTKIVGIDLLRSKLIECRIMLAHLSALVDQKKLPKLPEIEVLEMDFLQHGEWHTTADVVYACATCFSSKQLQLLLIELLRMKKDSSLIILDKELDCFLPDDDEERHTQLVTKSQLAAIAFPTNTITSPSRRRYFPSEGHSGVCHHLGDRLCVHIHETVMRDCVLKVRSNQI